MTDPEKIPSLVDVDGNFKSSKIYREAKEDFVVLSQVRLEIEAQYQRFLELFGRKPDYFEGHAVTSDNYFKAMKQFAAERGLKYSGLPQGQGPNSLTEDAFIDVNGTKVYLYMESMQADYDPYHTLNKLLANLHDDGVDMMIFHPGYLDDYILKNSSLLIPRTAEVAFLTDPAVKARLEQLKIELISYKEV